MDPKFSVLVGDTTAKKKCGKDNGWSVVDIVTIVVPVVVGLILLIILSVYFIPKYVKIRKRSGDWRRGGGPEIVKSAAKIRDVFDIVKIVVPVVMMDLVT